MLITLRSVHRLSRGETEFVSNSRRVELKHKNVVCSDLWMVLADGVSVRAQVLSLTLLCALSHKLNAPGELAKRQQ